ncbi:MAG: GntR family transcriptional regulator [Chloroflexi bacterium]|nr:GntR family transcriptional regulator [Chloroflexota bacterium]
MDPGRALYAQVAERLRERLASGEFKPGDRLPGEFQLSNEYRVSRVTIRAALAALEREGLIVKRQGLGSFVRTARARQVLARLETLDSSLAEQGLIPTARILDFAFGAAPDQLAATLGLPPESEVLVVRRLHTVEGGPIALVEMTLPASLGTHFSRRDVEEKPLYELLETRLGVRPGAASQSIRADAASGPVAEALGIQRGAPVLICDRITYDDAGRALQHTLFTYRADRFEFRVALSGRDSGFGWLPTGIVEPANAGPPATAE